MSRHRCLVGADGHPPVRDRSGRRGVGDDRGDGRGRGGSVGRRSGTRRVVAGFSTVRRRDLSGSRGHRPVARPPSTTIVAAATSIHRRPGCRPRAAIIRRRRVCLALVDVAECSPLRNRRLAPAATPTCRLEIVRSNTAQGEPQRRAELPLELIEVIELVHTNNPFNFVSARRRSERTVLAERPNSDAISLRPRSS